MSCSRCRWADRRIAVALGHDLSLFGHAEPAADRAERERKDRPGRRTAAAAQRAAAAVEEDDFHAELVGERRASRSWAS